MKRLLPLLLLIHSPAYCVPVVPNFTSGTMQSTTRTTSVVTENIVSHDYSGYQYSLNGSNISVDGNTLFGTGAMPLANEYGYLWNALVENGEWIAEADAPKAVD